MTMFDELANRFHDRHAEMAAALEGLPDEALDWVPGPEMNSITVLIAHSLGAERRLVGQTVLGQPPAAPREEEFAARGLGAGELKRRLAAADDFLRQGLPRLTSADLDAIRTTHHNEQKSVAWALLHALEHTAQHLGHVQITRQLWERKRK
jgi:hypothetical protein